MEILLHIRWMVYFRLLPCLSCVFCIIVCIQHLWMIITQHPHWFQVGCAHLPMSAWSGATVSLRLDPVRRQLQPLPSSVVIILAASDPTYMAVHCWQACISGGWKPPLEQSATRHHLSSKADCLSEPPLNLSLFPIIFFLTVYSFWFCTLCIVVV